MIKSILIGSFNALADLVTVETRATRSATDDLGLTPLWHPDDYADLIVSHGRCGSPSTLVARSGYHTERLFEEVQLRFREALDSTDPTAPDLGSRLKTLAEVSP